jgi:hypothetical protein
VSDYPKIETGFYHLTPKGWLRQDHMPVPEDRVETWSYEMVCPADDARDEVYLRRIWASPSTTSEVRDALRAKFGDPLSPTTTRNVTLECMV